MKLDDGASSSPLEPKGGTEMKSRFKMGMAAVTVSFTGMLPAAEPLDAYLAKGRIQA